MASMRDLLRVPAGPVSLDELPTDATPAAPGYRAETKEAVAARTPELADLQDRVMAAKQRLLVVLQGMDGCGKSGATKHVFGCLNPVALRYAAFKTPTEEERERHFLWRVRRRIPEPGTIGIWDRSHYEDVLVARVHGLVPRDVWQTRYGEINVFERELAGEGIVLLKVFLNISYEEQCARMLDRLADPTKRWKFKAEDIGDHERWDEYQAAYEDLLERCNTPHAPWYAVPADHKWYRNWAVQSLVLETLREMDPQYPAREDIDDDRFRERLARV
jgi:PPK2 family polyphosphate:nucleotide phosphotransferase